MSFTYTTMLLLNSYTTMLLLNYLLSIGFQKLSIVLSAPYIHNFHILIIQRLYELLLIQGSIKLLNLQKFKFGSVNLISRVKFSFHYKKAGNGFKMHFTPSTGQNAISDDNTALNQVIAGIYTKLLEKQTLWKVIRMRKIV